MIVLRPAMASVRPAERRVVGVQGRNALPELACRMPREDAGPDLVCLCVLYGVRRLVALRLD